MEIQEKEIVHKDITVLEQAAVNHRVVAMGLI